MNKHKSLTEDKKTYHGMKRKGNDKFLQHILQFVSKKPKFPEKKKKKSKNNNWGKKIVCQDLFFSLHFIDFHGLHKLQEYMR